VAADKRRGCLVMGKGLCHQDKSLLGQLTSLANKLTSIMESAKKTVGKMFDSSTATLTSHQKEVGFMEKLLTRKKFFFRILLIGWQGII
jgi:hypothetical protein